MLTDNKSIAIIGGGPAGLTLARLLQRKGAEVKVYERDFNKEARVQGSPLDMHEGSGLAALEAAGLMDAFKRTYRPGADKMVITNDQGQVLLSDHDTHEAAFGDPGFRPEIDRGPLRNLLLESLKPETVVWDRHFLSMEAKGEGWQLHFKNGSPAYADIVVAADGANSKIRPYLTDAKPFYSGITMLEGNVTDSEKAAPNIHVLAAGGKIMAFGHSKNLLLGQKGNGDLGFYASFKVPENWAAQSGLDFGDKVKMLDWFRNFYPEWSPVWVELFESASLPFVPRPIYCAPLDQNWKTLPNLTLLGDAAHVMPPFAGEGANMAMLDALELSRALTSGQFANLQDAIAAYETDMRERGALAAKESLENGEKMHSETALQTMLEMFGGH